MKNAMDALGVPHTEVGALHVNGEPATLQRIVRAGDYEAERRIVLTRDRELLNAARSRAAPTSAS